MLQYARAERWRLIFAFQYVEMEELEEKTRFDLEIEKDRLKMLVLNLKT